MLAGLLICLLAGCATACGQAPQIVPKVDTIVQSVRRVHPPYTATLHLPQVVWSGRTAAAAKMNAAVSTWASGQLAAFAASVTRDLSGTRPLTASLPPSQLTVTYQVARDDTAALSFRFLVEPYVSGAAHPSQLPAGLTFDLPSGDPVSLAALFKPGSDYVPLLARAAGAGLAAFHPAGAHCYLGRKPPATASSFASWWLSADGLVLAFPAGAYTADYCGPPTVTVPYVQLQPLAAPSEPA